MSNTSLANLFRLYGQKLQRHLMQRGAPPDVAADLTQEAFLRLLRADPAAPVQAPEAYLYRTAVNLSIDRRRSDMRRGVVPLSAELQETAADPQPLAEAGLLSREELAVLRRAIDDLPPRGREIFLLHKFEGVGYAEIAERLGIAKNTVMVHMVRSLAHCKKRLDAYRRDAG